MPRTSPVHYINPLAISLTANANGSTNDIAVYIDRNAKIKVYSPKVGLNLSSGDYQEWSLRGRNRRLANSAKKYAIYARLRHNDHEDGYLVFAAMEQYAEGPRAGQWYEKYWHVGPEGWEGGYEDEDGWAVIEPDPTYWYIKLGEVSLPENHQRTIDLDTGILGTEQFNTEWALNPDSLPLRIEFSCTINDDDAGPTPYVYWGQTLLLVAMLTEGWNGTDIERFDHWEILRDTGSDADTAWNTAVNASDFRTTGSIELMHGRGATQGVRDDFNSAVNTTFTVNAMERTDDPEQGGTPTYAVLKSASICIMAETWEKYELSLAAQMVTYNPISQSYTPSDGVTFNVRATDQKSEVFLMTRQQVTDAGLVVEYAAIDSSSWTAVAISGQSGAVAIGKIAKEVFYQQKSINIRLRNSDDTEHNTGTELFRTTIAFLKDGEDSKEREWIFLRSATEITFGTQEHPYPASISGGQVNPTGAATGSDTNKNQDSWVPEGWWDEQQGVDATNRYEYGAYRDFVKENGNVAAHWGTFTEPKIWNHFGIDGTSPWIATSDKATDSIQCDVNGTVTAQQSVGVNLSLLHGSEAQSFKIAGIKRNSTTVDESRSLISSGIMFVIDNDTFSSLPSAAATAHSLGVIYYPTSTINGKDDIEITLTDADGGNQKVLHLIINGIRPGTKGDPGDDASEVNPNILLRTIFDKGIDFVKEKWQSNWSGTSIDTATDTIVEGRKSIRINAGILSTNEFIDFRQNVYGKLKPSTWYTLSFNYFSTHNFSTFLWGGDNTPLVIDRSAGFYQDGTFIAEPPLDGNAQWEADWTGARHTLTFKTIDTFPSEYFWVMFRTYHIDGTTDRAQLALCMPKLEIGEVATAYMANEDDLVGEKGEDAVNVVVSPASMIVEQDINNKNNIAYAADNNLGQFSIQVLKGIATACTITRIVATASQVYVYNSPSTGQQDPSAPCDWQPNSQIANLYLKGIAKDNQNNYYTTGQIVLAITYTDPDTGDSKTISNIIARVYVNLIGTWSKKVVGDAKTEVAKSLSYAYDSSGQNVVSLENIGKFIKSSTQDTSELRQKVYVDILNLTYPATSSSIDGMTVNVLAGTYKVAGEFNLANLPTGNGHLTFVGPGVNKTWDLTGGLVDSIDDEVTFTSAGVLTISAGDDVSSGSAYDILNLAIYQSQDKIAKLELTADGLTSDVKAIKAGKNLLTLTSGWEDYGGAAVNYDNKYFGVKSSGYLYSPVRLGVEGEQYCFSAYIAVGSQTAGNPGFCYGTSYTHASDLDDNGTYQSATFIEIPGDTIMIGSTPYQRYYFRIPGSIVKDYYFTIYNDGGYWLYYPQLELGTEPTAFAPSSVEISSQIKQTASEISLDVQRDIEGKLYNTGIKIDGDNRQIDLIAGKVNFCNSQGAAQTYVQITSDGKIKATDGEFSGKIVADRGKIASGIIDGNWLISSYGQIDGGEYGDTDEFEDHLAHLYFDPSNPQGFKGIPTTIHASAIEPETTYSDAASVMSDPFTPTTGLRIVKIAADVFAGEMKVALFSNGSMISGTEITLTPSSYIGYIVFTSSAQQCEVRAHMTEDSIYGVINGIYQIGFAPHFAVDLSAGKSYQDDANIGGIIKAQIAYTPTKTYNRSTTAETIVPGANYPSAYRVITGTANKVFTLPDPRDYDGLELSFFVTQYPGTGYGCILKAPTGYSIYFNKHQVVYIDGSNFALPVVNEVESKTQVICGFGQNVTLRAMDNNWYVVQGRVS